MDIQAFADINRSIHGAIRKDKEDDDFALIKGALSTDNDRCPFKRNTSVGKRLAARWDLGRRMAREIGQTSA